MGNFGRGRKGVSDLEKKLVKKGIEGRGIIRWIEHNPRMGPASGARYAS
jgi:hypothetical protein